MATFYTDTASFNSLTVTGSTVMSASVNTTTLQLFGSGSTIFSVSGSNGEIFTITDTSTNPNLFSVSTGSTTVFSVDSLKNVSISGSLVVTGSITGSLLGTASFAATASNIFPAITNNVNNYVLTATGSGTINGESNLVFDGTNLGIGKTSPTATLDVLGNTSLSGSLLVSGSTTIRGTTTISGSLLVSGSTTIRGITTITGSLLVSGSSGLTVLGPAVVKGLGSNDFTVQAPDFIGGSAGTGLTFTSPSSNAPATLGVRTTGGTGNGNLTVLSGTNLIVSSSLAVGKASPSTTLDVSGNATISGSLLVSGSTTIRGTTTITGSLVVSGSLISNGNTTITGSLFLSSSTSTLGQFAGNQNGFAEFSVRNNNTGISASGDIVVYANNGTVSNNYIDMGINNSGMTSSYSFFGTDFGNANDAYLYNVGGDLRIGNATSVTPFSQSFHLFSNPTATPNITMTGSRVGINKSSSLNATLDIVGTVIVTGSLILTGSLSMSLATGIPSSIVSPSGYYSATINGAAVFIPFYNA